jgi:hypothetical protein
MVRCTTDFAMPDCKCMPDYRYMNRVAVIFSLVAVFACAADAPLGPKGTMGIDLVRNKSFDRAVSFLEDGLTETPDNPVLYENLGIAYLGCGGTLNAAQCREKAEAAMAKALDLGGRATFLVDISTEKGGLLKIKEGLLEVKRGWLHISKTGLEFDPERPDPKFPPVIIAAADIKGYQMNSGATKGTNMFHIDGKPEPHDFRTADFSAEEAQIVFRLIEKYLGVAPKKK